MSILHERNLWNQATNTEREQIIQKLLKKELRYFFDYVEMRTYSCNDIENTIAIFQHRSSKMLFHLLPGDIHFKIGASSQEQYQVIQKRYGIDLDEFSGHLIEVVPFLISRYLITETAWQKFGGRLLPRTFGDRYPVHGVERHEVQSWAHRAKLALPSEVEWEYACKAGSETIFYWGDEPNLDYAWTRENILGGENTTLLESQQKTANAFGLLGMIGNLAEWIADDAYPFINRDIEQEPFKDMYNTSTDGVLRGGWNQYGWQFNRSTSRIRCHAANTGCSARVVFRLSNV